MLEGHELRIHIDSRGRTTTPEQLETNAFHMALIAAGERVMEDYTVMTAHGYDFSCGCTRIYNVDLIRLKDSESAMPCRKHLGLARRLNVRTC